MNANEITHPIIQINLAEERFQWACALAYAYDMNKREASAYIDTLKSSEQAASQYDTPEEPF